MHDLPIKQQQMAWSQLSAEAKSEIWWSVPSNQITCSLTSHSEVNVGAHQSQIVKCGLPTLTVVSLFCT